MLDELEREGYIRKINTTPGMVEGSLIMDAELKKLREEFGLKHVLNKEALRPEARGKTAAEIIRYQRKNMKRY